MCVHWKSRCILGRLSSYLEVEEIDDCYAFNYRNRIYQLYLYYQKRLVDRLNLLRRRHSPAYTDRSLYGLLERTPGSYESFKYRTYTIYRYVI